MSDARTPGTIERWQPLLWAGVFVSVAGLLQLSLPNFFDGDTGYHLAVARLTREHGLLDAFPWTPFSWLAERYADKELLFHLLLVPLASLEPNTAAAIAGTLLGAGLLFTLYTILRHEGALRPGLWTLAALLCSSAFVWRFALVRPHLLSIALALGVLWAAARSRLGVLAALCAIFPWAYTAWHLPLVLVGIAVAARAWVTGERAWQPLAVAAGALALGVVVHPDFPNNLAFFWIQNVEVLFQTAWSGQEGFDLGGEFRPFSPLGMLRYLAGPAALLVLAGTVGVRRRPWDPLALAALVTAAAFFVLTLRTQRFIEYAAPFAALAVGLCLRPAPAGDASPAQPGRWQHAPALALGIGLVWMLALGLHPFERLWRRSELFPPPVAEALQTVVPPGSQIFTCDWEFTGEMMLALPERRFLVALDPVLFATRDPDAYRLWFELVRHPPSDPATHLRRVFDADFVLCDQRPRWRPFLGALQRDPATRALGVAGFWHLYAVHPDAGTGNVSWITRPPAPQP